ncbi:hypothetical protein [Qiania dongpingensis]|uniref:ABC-2 family transporter protein n=1 Tax=Qiania dongpingensis TaxID=2763669 RepID=A0A7G9G746_9FIRM|nr:hypothetical protein [Qiania dongpingensis]QNM06628.1 hypothetical protein H9Q78_05815 [Qiania dongpingensis]
MTRLFYFEFKKLFSKKAVPFFFLFLLLFNGIMIYRESRGRYQGYLKADVSKVYESLDSMTALEAEETITERVKLLEAVDVWRQWADGFEAWTEEDKQSFRNVHKEVMNQYPDLDIEDSYLLYLKNFYDEQSLLSDVLEQVSAVAHYEEYLEGIEEEARIMTASSLFGDPGTFSYRNIEKTPPAYEHLEGTVLPAASSEGIILATESKVTDILLLFLLAVLGISILIGEREEGTLLLIRPMKKGYLETITAKLLLVLILSALASLIFYGMDFLISHIVFGMGDLGRPIQSVKGFLTSPYEMTAGQYLAGFLAAKTAAALVWSILIFCLCTVFKNGISACLAMGVTFSIEFLLYLTIGIHSYLSPLKILNLVCLADAPWFFGDYLNMNLFGWPVNVVPVCIGTGILAFFLSCTFSIQCYLTESSSSGIENRMISFLQAKIRKKRNKKRNIRISLFLKEFYKIFIMEKAWILLVLFCFLQWNTYKGFEVYTDSDDKFYQYYIDQAEGLPLQETAFKYQEEYNRFETLAKENKSASDLYASGKLPYMEWQEINTKYMAVTRGMIGFDRAVSQYEHVLNEKRAGRDAELFYDTGWQALFDRSGQREDVMNVGKLSFFLILGLSAVFSVEKSSKVEMLQKAYLRGGGSVCIRKYVSCFIYGTAAYLIAYLPRYLSVFSEYGTAGFSAPLKSLNVLSEIPFNIPLWAYLLAVGISRYLGMLAAVGLILWLSKRCGNMVHTILIAMLVLELPVFLYLMGIIGETYFSLLPMMTGFSMYRLTAVRIVYWCVALAVGCWLYFRTYEEGGI